MTNISSNTTLAFKFAIPIIWLVFFGSFMVGAWLTESTPTSGPSLQTKIGLTVFFGLGFLFFYWSMLRLKRIEVDKEFVYVTNYFKTYRYPWHNIEKIEEKDYLLFKTLHLHLKVPGKFGSKVYCLLSQKRFNEFIAKSPATLAPFLNS